MSEYNDQKAGEDPLHFLDRSKRVRFLSDFDISFNYLDTYLREIENFLQTERNRMEGAYFGLPEEEHIRQMDSVHDTLDVLQGILRKSLFTTIYSVMEKELDDLCNAAQSKNAEV